MENEKNGKMLTQPQRRGVEQLKMKKMEKC